MESYKITLDLTQEDINQIWLGLDARTVDVQKRVKGDTSAWIGNIPELKRQIQIAWQHAQEDDPWSRPTNDIRHQL